ncbi:MAG: TonB-dependent receptor [Oceanobacter sp.]
MNPQTPNFVRSRVCLALAAVSASASVCAEMEEVVAIGQQSAVFEVAQPVTRLDGDAIRSEAKSTLGDLLERLPGVSNASFGPGVGRPVIRGMASSRVKVLTNGTDAADVSAMSSDHAPMAELSAAQTIEVVQGPATLRYGGGAIGGVVNLSDSRIHRYAIEDTELMASSTLSSLDNGRSLAVTVDSGNGDWVLHADGFVRRSDNYQTGTQGKKTGQRDGEIINSDTKGKGGALGLSRTSDDGFIGLSIARLEYDYGVPNEDNKPARVKPEQTRYEMRGALYLPFGEQWNAVEEWRVNASYNDYIHDETTADLVVGLFDQETWQLQTDMDLVLSENWTATTGIQWTQRELALCHDHGGCSDIPDYSSRSWDGQMGLDLSQSFVNGYFFAHDTPMPETTTQDIGLFWIAQRDWEHGMIEMGIRVDERTIELDENAIRPSHRQQASYYDDRDFTPVSISAAATWILDEQQRLGFSLARAQRAPDAEEMFWNGDHHATFSFQLDNGELDLETAYTLDVNWLYQGDEDALRIAAFAYEFEDYIYNDLKPFGDPFHDNLVYRHEQADARFYGAEASWEHALNDSLNLELAADWVRARLTSGSKDNLPRTPSPTLRAGLTWQQDEWQLRAESVTHGRQTNVAANEVSTASYSQLNLAANYQLSLAKTDLDLSLKGNNLTDTYGQSHTSYLKEYAPIAGRNLVFSATLRY